MMEGAAANGLLWLAVVNAFILVIFVSSFAKPESRYDWRSLGAFSAFIVALFAEMFGLPLTIYVLSSLLASRYPGVDPFAYSAGRLWHTLFGLGDDSVFNPILLLSYVLVSGGFILVACAWRGLYDAQRNRQLAQTGPYSYVRHPQYAGFIMIMLGLLLMWPTLSSLIMFPILVIVYVYLARREEQDALRQLRDEYRHYMKTTPPFFPGLLRRTRKVERKP